MVHNPQSVQVIRRRNQLKFRLRVLALFGAMGFVAWFFWFSPVAKHVPPTIIKQGK